MFFTADGKRDQTEKRPTFLAMLALQQPGAITASALIAQLRSAYPGYSEELANAGKPDDKENDAMLLRMGQDVLTIIPVDRPMPPGAMDMAAARTAIFWPTAKQELARHQAHVIVAKMLSLGSDNGKLGIARKMTLACAALSSIVPTIGVYWSESEMVIPALAFQGAADQLMKGELPVEAWMHLGFMRAPYEREPHAIACITTGLVPFIGREIEVLPTTLQPAQIAERLLGLARYLAVKGQILKDGETVGLSQTEKFRVQLVPQGQRPGIPVIQLKLESLDATAGLTATAPARPVSPAQPAFTGGFGKRQTPVKGH